jgi:AcrR family transcriptional regulator
VTRTRLTAAERREQVVATSLKHFAHGGFHGTSTEAIAEDIGLSQPYLFRLFNTKRELFLACCTACNQRIRDVFTDACAGETPEERMHSMGMAYDAVLTDEDLLAFQLQMYAAAAADPVIREEAGALFRELVEDVRRLAGVDDETLKSFFAKGMLMNVAVTLGIDELRG